MLTSPWDTAIHGKKWSFVVVSSFTLIGLLQVLLPSRLLLDRISAFPVRLSAQATYTLPLVSSAAAVGLLLTLKEKRNALFRGMYGETTTGLENETPPSADLATMI